MTHRGPFHPLPFCDSVKVYLVQQICVYSFNPLPPRWGGISTCITSLGTRVPPWHGPMRHQGPSTQNTSERSSEAGGEQGDGCCCGLAGGQLAAAKLADLRVLLREKSKERQREKAKGGRNGVSLLHAVFDWRLREMVEMVYVPPRHLGCCGMGAASAPVQPRQLRQTLDQLLRFPHQLRARADAAVRPVRPPGLFSELVPVALQSSHGVWVRESLLYFHCPWNSVYYESFAKKAQNMPVL